MAMLYGDASPFPLGENFIETLRDATDVCYLLLRSDEIIAEIRQQVDAEKQVAERDHAGFNRLATAINQSLEPHAADDSPTVAEVANRLLQTAQGVLEGAVKDLVGRRDTRLREMDGKVSAERARIPRELERFLLQHELPNTVWGLTWSMSLAGGAVQAQSIASTPFGLEATFELDLAADPLWSKPVRIQEITQELNVPLPQKAGWLGRGSSLKEEQLDRYYLTEVRMDTQRTVFKAYRALKSSALGYEITMDLENGSAPRARLLEEQETSTETVAIEGPAADELHNLRRSIAAQLRPLCRRRTRLVSGALNGVALAQVDSPASVAQLLIGAIAPYVREMVLRSPIEGEIVLKREVENGKREEMFISISELTAKFSGLTPTRRASFDELGLFPEKPGRTMRPPSSGFAPLEESHQETTSAGTIPLKREQSAEDSVELEGAPELEEGSD